MRKHVLFSVMLSLGILGGLSVCPVPAMASVTQAQTIKVSGQVVDQTGEPLIGATIKVKGVTSGVVSDFDGNFTIDAPGDFTNNGDYSIAFGEVNAIYNYAAIEEVDGKNIKKYVRVRRIRPQKI